MLSMEYVVPTLVYTRLAELTQFRIQTESGLLFQVQQDMRLTHLITEYHSL